MMVPMNDGKATATPEATGPDTGLASRQYYVMVGIGAFVTTLAQPSSGACRSPCC